MIQTARGLSSLEASSSSDRRALGAVRFECLHGIRGDVVADAVMTVAKQPPDEPGAHPAEPDHSQLHWRVRCHPVSPLYLRMNRSTAFANPSSSFDVVTWRAARWTSRCALPIAIERPECANMSTSFGMSPIVAISSSGIPYRADRNRATSPLFACGCVTST